jgi:hypothetical protein
LYICPRVLWDWKLWGPKLSVNCNCENLIKKYFLRTCNGNAIMYGMNHHIDIQTCINEDPRICGVRPQFPKFYIYVAMETNSTVKPV